MVTSTSFASVAEFLEKVAEAPLSEPGSIGGETSHPVKNVDDRLQKAPEGERSKENTKDVKADQGAPSIENAGTAKAAAPSVFDRAAALAKKASEMCKTCKKAPCACAKTAESASTPGSAESDQIQIGTKKAPTGEDPSNETSSAKGGKDDRRQGDRGGTEHPASTENTSLDGHKYAYTNDTPLEKIAGDMQELGDALCASIAWIGQNQDRLKQATAPQAPATAATLDPALAGQAGWELGGLINGTMDKRAADAMVTRTLAEIIKTAAEDADRYVTFRQSMAKAAEGPPEPAAGGGPPPGGAGGPPPGGGGGGEEMLGQLGGGEAAGGPGGPGGAGGGGAGGGGEGEEAELAQLLQMLASQGITPEQAMQMIQEEMAAGGGAPGGGPPGGGPPGGGPPGGGAPPPPPPGPPGGGGGGLPGMEAQASDRHKTAHMSAYIKELITRHQQRR